MYRYGTYVRTRTRECILARTRYGDTSTVRRRVPTQCAPPSRPGDGEPVEQQNR